MQGYKAASIKRHTAALVAVSLVITISFSCHSKTKILGDGWTRITTNEYDYRNKALFNTDLLLQLDTNALYKECCTVQKLDSSHLGLNKTKRYTSYNYSTESRREYFRFYSNGYCNLFITADPANASSFDPQTTGFRGVYYRDNKDRIRIDLFTQTSGAGRFSNLKKFVTVAGDSLFIRTRENNGIEQVFIKEALPKAIKEVRGWQ